MLILRKQMEVSLVSARNVAAPMLSLVDMTKIVVMF
jgi:hypothetical protein